MIQITYADAKAEIARVCGVSGMAVTDPRVLSRTNAAIQELMSEGEFPNIVDRWHIIADSGHIVLPTFLDRLMQINIRGIPRTIASPWYQFVAYGPGTSDDNPDGFGNWWCDDRMITDRGEYPTRVALPEVGGPWNLRIYTAVDERIDGVTPYCTIQGLDPDGLIVRTQLSDGSGTWINGERVSLDFLQPYVQTTEQFTQVDVFTKPDTNGYIRMTAWDGVTEIELSNYLPTDTTPSYHHYHSQWLSDLDAASDSPLRVVRARCRKRYVPIRSDTDQMIISNLPALKEMVIAVFKREADNLQSYAIHKQTAVDLMKKEAMSYRGKSRIPGLTFQRGYPVGRLPGLR